VVNATTRPLYPRESPGTLFIGGWVGPRAGLDGYGTSPQRDSIPGTSLIIIIIIIINLIVIIIIIIIIFHRSQFFYGGPTFRKSQIT
jgi:hypothetical protein